MLCPKSEDKSCHSAAIFERPLGQASAAPISLNGETPAASESSFRGSIPRQEGIKARPNPHSASLHVSGDTFF